MQLLKFGKANNKLAKLEKRLGKKLYSVSLKAGYSCPGANLCFAKYDSAKHEIVDGANAQLSTDQYHYGSLPLSTNTR